MNLLVDSGATKTSWTAFYGNYNAEITTGGINVAHMDERTIDGTVREAVHGLTVTVPAFDRFGCRPERIFFYAAGLVGKIDSPVPESARVLDGVMKKYFPDAEIEYASDLVGAARAACGHEEGIAAIIGTGANTCQFDGRRIVRQIPCGGFIIGDEGSAAVLGKRFITDFLKDQMPAELSGDFASSFKVDYPTIVKEVYKGDAPAGYLGSFAPYILSKIDIPYVRELVEDNFKGLFERAILRYDRLPVGVVGGFGCACKDILTRMGSGYGVKFSKFIRSPKEGLLKYHGV